jgi:hypothetical protein
MASQLSASAHLAQFGFTTKQANDWIIANIGTPKTIIDVCQQFGVTRAMLSEITGYGVDLITSFFSLYNLDATNLDKVNIVKTNVDVELFSLTHALPGILTFDASKDSYNIILDFDKVKTTINLGGYKVPVYSLSDKLVNFGSDDTLTLKNYESLNIASGFTNDVTITGFSKSNVFSFATVQLVGVNTGKLGFSGNGSQGVDYFNTLSVGDIQNF